jgi:hypothetical protein
MLMYNIGGVSVIFTEAVLVITSAGCLARSVRVRMFGEGSANFQSDKRRGFARECRTALRLFDLR